MIAQRFQEIARIGYGAGETRKSASGPGSTQPAQLLEILDRHDRRDGLAVAREDDLVAAFDIVDALD